MIALLAQTAEPIDGSWTVVTAVVVFLGSAAAVWFGTKPLLALISREEAYYDRMLRGRLLMDIAPRTVTVAALVAAGLLAVIGMGATGGLLGAVLAGGVGLVLPRVYIRVLARRRLAKLEEQLVSGIQTVSSGVRAGLNLVQAMELVSRDGARPLREEFAHLLREYEYGIPLDEAMDNASRRIGSGDFRLLFSALQTHRQRGGDLGETLDRIADSVREIQRLENRVKSLTAQGRATARWLGAMPMVVLAILYFFRVSPEGVRQLFIDDYGKLIVVAIVTLNVIGFLWVRKIMDVDI